MFPRKPKEPNCSQGGLIIAATQCLAEGWLTRAQKLKVAARNAIKFTSQILQKTSLCFIVFLKFSILCEMSCHSFSPCRLTCHFEIILYFKREVCADELCKRTLEPTPAQATSLRLGRNASGLIITASACFPRHAGSSPHHVLLGLRESLCRPIQTSFIKDKEI